MLVRGLECRHRVARLLSALANRDVDHHRTPPSLAGSWSLDLSRSVTTVYGSPEAQTSLQELGRLWFLSLGKEKVANVLPFKKGSASAVTTDGKATYLAFVV